MHYLGIIGFGGVAKWHYGNLQGLADRITVKGVYDINPAKGEIAKSLGLVSYGSAKELLDDADIDIVLVSTPNNFHKEYVISALEAGKNVICEKPVALSVADFDEMCAVANECGKVFSVHQNRRWDKDFRIVKKIYDDRVIGKPFYIESRVQGANGIPGDWRFTKVAGGGMVLDWGVHLLDQILWMVNSPVTEVYANLYSIKAPEVDDNFKAILKFENGTTAHVQVDTYCFIPLPRWHISGDAGTAVIDNWKCEGKIVKSKLVEMIYEPSIIYTGSGPTKTMSPRPSETIEELPLPEDVDSDIKNLFRNLMDVIEGKAERIIKLEEVRRVLQVIEAIFESSEKGTAIKKQI